MNEIIEISGTKFKVSESWTRERLQEMNYTALLSEFCKNGIKRQIYATRLNGGRLFIINEYLSGSFSGYKKPI